MEEVEELNQKGLLQLFCEENHYDFIIRIITPDKENAKLLKNYPKKCKEEYTLPILKITDWKKINDYPDIYTLGLDKEIQEKYSGIQDIDDLADILSEDFGFKCRYKHKILGYPNWIQHEELHHCKKCSKKMKMIFQMDSIWGEDKYEWLWGDAGNIHVYQCPKHHNFLDYDYQCH